MRKRFLLFLYACCAFGAAQAQGGTNFVVDAGFQAQRTTIIDLGFQVKHYWVFDTALSNNGPGAACEVNFGVNSSGITIGPKIFYQGDIFMGNTGHNKSISIYLLARLSLIRYTNSDGNDYRVAPEAGVSVYDKFSLIYGYNFPMPFVLADRLSAVYSNRITLLLTLGGKDEKKAKGEAPAPEVKK